MLLQHAMLLLGGVCPDKVSEANIREATAVLKEYNRILIAKGRVDLQTIRWSIYQKMLQHLNAT